MTLVKITSIHQITHQSFKGPWKLEKQRLIKEQICSYYQASGSQVTLCTQECPSLFMPQAIREPKLRPKLMIDRLSGFLDREMLEYMFM